MPKIEIEIDRPWLTLALIVGVIAAVVHFSGESTQASVTPVGGDTSEAVSPAMAVVQAEQDIARERDTQRVLDLREQILRGQLDLLEEEAMQTNNPKKIQSLTDTRNALIRLLLDRTASEERIREYLHQIWDAEAIAGTSSRQTHDNSQVTFMWPVEPLLGISAHFNDSVYEKRFGMPHHAIDIPTAQGTVVAAAADGVVVKVSDQGMGFNSLVIKHAGGYSTLYGHVSKFFVTEGQEVSAGDPVALSGGTPGTPGAGLMTTGAHLHLALFKDGEAVDPMGVLPQ